ncbi:MAG: ornithine cyclodeaminase family protein [Synergistaceae bacterium]|jgi:ornithine cyclodeaminase|nr:ornithine cyclodeaminase family protein [Synergistaceae bacterium]
MLVLDARSIRRLFSMEEAIDSNREAFVIQSQGGADVPVRISFNLTGTDVTSFMPAFIEGFPQAGVKIVSTFPGNTAKGIPAVSATLLLTDPVTGEVSVLMDGTELTRLRTGAVSGLATKLFANENVEAGALFGTGGQAHSQLEAMLTARHFKEIRVFDLDPSRVEAFISRTCDISEKFDVSLVKADSSDAAVDGADVITTVTTSANPVFDGRRVKEGAHINAVGGFLPHKRELDEYIVNRADRIFIDNMEAVMAEAGEFLIPMAEGRFSRESITGEIGDVLLGKTRGRTSPDEITLMKTVGFATLDVVIGYKIFKKALAEGVGITI